MNIVEGSSEVPVIYTAHHASHDFGEFESRVALSDEQKLRFSDYGTDLTVPQNGITAIIGDKSRALGDLNRDPDDPGRFQAQDYSQPTRHDIWKPNQGLSEFDKVYCQNNFYDPFHDAITAKLKTRNELTFVVAWDNTAHYMIGDYVSGKTHMMKPFILSNRGLDNSAKAGPDEPTSCDPKFLQILAENFASELGSRDLPTEIHLNFVMKGGYICRRYNTLRSKDALKKLGVTTEVQSLQLEYDTAITHDQITLQPKPDKIEALRQAFSEAISKATRQYSLDRD